MKKENEKVGVWLDRISKSEKVWEDYHKLIEEIREYYKNEKKKNKQNIFWSSIETLKPFLYFKQPTPYVERNDKKENPVLDAACKIVHRALTWNLKQQDFDGIIKYTRNDYLLSGMGLAYEKYEPVFKKIQIADEFGGIVEADVIERETVKTVYFDPIYFIADSEKVGIWEDCLWVGRKINMTKKEAINQFGKEIAQYIVDDKEDINEEYKKNTVVYEIWDKETKKIYYVSPECKEKFLRFDEDKFNIEGFFPMPKPIATTLTNNSIVPIPDYTEIKSLLDELDGVNNRMRLIMQAIKVSGVYDNSVSELENIFNKDITLVGMAEFERLKGAGGIKGCIDFIPIDQYVSCLQVLAERRTMLTNAIYEVTGVSDIMRGNADPNETATAVNKKTNFGTLRNQDRQNDMQRFLTDLFRIKAEMICEHFSEETLMSFADGIDEAIALQAIELLRQDKLRSISLGIETEKAFEQEETLDKAVRAVKMISDMINKALPLVSQQPLLLPIYKQMMDSIVNTLPSARQFSNTIDDAFAKIAQELSQPKQPEPDPAVIKAQAAMMKAENEKQEVANNYEVQQRANDIKETEVALKKQAEDNKIILTNKEMNIQADLEREKMRLGQKASTNISTGYVRGFHV